MAVTAVVQNAGQCYKSVVLQDCIGICESVHAGVSVPSVSSA